MGDHPIANFDSLLRNLLTYDLVEQSEERWVLRPSAAQRLSELAGQSRPQARISVYVGYFCERCHSAGITHAVEGSRLCGRCIAAAADPEEGGMRQAVHPSPTSVLATRVESQRPAVRNRTATSTTGRPGVAPRHAPRRRGL